MKSHQLLRAGVAAVLALVVTACGSDDKAPETASPTTAAGAPEPLPAGQGDPQAMGVDTVAWPADTEGARALFQQMPEQLAGWKGKRPGGEGSSVGMFYGPGDRGVSAFTMSADEEIPDPQSVLAAMFGLGLACDKDTYVGTAQPMRGGYGPGIAGGGTPKEPWWFACTVDGAEGDPQFTAHAIGWTSEELGWLVVAPDQNTARLAVEAMIKAG